MDKVEVGMYVRTKYRKEHVIRKIMAIYEDDLVEDIEDAKNQRYFQKKEQE